MSLEVIGELARHAPSELLFLVAGYRRRRVPGRWHPSRVAMRGCSASDTRRGPAPAADGRGDRDRDHPDPGRRASGATRRGRGGPRADERHPAPHRGAARRRSTTRRAPTAGASARPTCRTRSGTRSSRGSGGCRTTPGRRSGRRRRSAAASAPTSWPGWSDRPLAELEPTHPGAGERRSCTRSSTSTTATTTSATSCCGTRSTTLSRRQLRRFHAQAAEFVMTLEARAVHASRHYERAASGRRRSGLARGAAEASRISARHEATSCTGAPLPTCPRPTGHRSRPELLRAFSDAAGAIEHNEDDWRWPRSARASTISRRGSQSTRPSSR